MTGLEEQQQQQQQQQQHNNKSASEQHTQAQVDDDAPAIPNDLGERVLQGQLNYQTLDSTTFGRHMCKTIAALLGIWFVLFTSICVVVLTALPVDANTEILFDKFLTENIYEDIVDATLPSVRNWYRALPPADQEQLLPKERLIESNSNVGNNGDCVSQFFDEMTQVVNETSPAHVDLVLTSLRLKDNLLVRTAVEDLLLTPQPLMDWVNATSSCYAESNAMQQLCLAYRDATEPPKPDYSIGSPSRAVLTYFANVFAVYETLTVQASTDIALLSELSSHMIDIKPAQEQAYEETIADATILEFSTIKYQGVAQSMHALNLALATNTVPPGLDKSLQINILEAAKVDMELGHDANARVGVALAAALKYGPVVENHEATWQHGRDWTEAYISWNMAFIVGSVGLNRLIKLTIPSVACTPNNQDGEGFITPRVISLALGLMHEFPTQEALDSDDFDGISQEELDQIQEFYILSRKNVVENAQERYQLADDLGMSTLYHTRLPSPSRDTVERMLYTLCDETCFDATWKFSKRTFRSQAMTDEVYLGYVSFILWITTLLAGFGLELLMWLNLVSSQEGWSRKLEKQWVLAQFVFPLLATTCLGLASHQNYMALPFLVSGLWKFGMPEAVSYMHTALYKPRGKGFNMHFFINIFNSVGTLLHHSSAAIPIVMMLAGKAVVDRHILDPILILVMQHWFILVRYFNINLYLLIELILEGLFELSVISEFQYLYSRHWGLAAAALGMLLAHWLYLAAAALEFFASSTEQTDASVNREEDIEPLFAGDVKDQTDDTKTDI